MPLSSADLADLLGLPARRHVAVDHADTPAWAMAMAAGPPSRYPGRRNDRQVQEILRGVAVCREIDFAGQHFGMAGLQQHIVESQSLFKRRSCRDSHATPVEECGAAGPSGPIGSRCVGDRIHATLIDKLAAAHSTPVTARKLNRSAPAILKVGNFRIPEISGKNDSPWGWSFCRRFFGLKAVCAAFPDPRKGRAAISPWPILGCRPSRCSSCRVRLSSPSSGRWRKARPFELPELVRHRENPFR